MVFRLDMHFHWMAWGFRIYEQWAGSLVSTTFRTTSLCLIGLCPLQPLPLRQANKNVLKNLLRQVFIVEFIASRVVWDGFRIVFRNQKRVAGRDQHIYRAEIYIDNVRARSVPCCHLSAKVQETEGTCESPREFISSPTFHHGSLLRNSECTQDHGILCISLSSYPR